MKVIAVNGSPRANGNTYTALDAACKELNKNGIDTEIIHIGQLKLTGCKACEFCGKNGGKCVFDDGLNEAAEKIRAADGLIIGAPVYYAGINGTVKSFLDRLFYTSSASALDRILGGEDKKQYCNVDILEYIERAEKIKKSNPDMTDGLTKQLFGGMSELVAGASLSDE